MAEADEQAFEDQRTLGKIRYYREKLITETDELRSATSEIERLRRECQLLTFKNQNLDKELATMQNFTSYVSEKRSRLLHEYNHILAEKDVDVENTSAFLTHLAKLNQELAEVLEYSYKNEQEAVGEAEQEELAYRKRLEPLLDERRELQSRCDKSHVKLEAVQEQKKLLFDRCEELGCKIEKADAELALLTIDQQRAKSQVYAAKEAIRARRNDSYAASHRFVYDEDYDGTCGSTASDVKTAVSGSSAEVTSETKTSASQQHINCAHLSSSQSDLSEEDSEEQLDPQDKGEPKSDDIDSDASAFKAFGPSVARQPVSEGSEKLDQSPREQSTQSDKDDNTKTDSSYRTASSTSVNASHDNDSAEVSVSPREAKESSPKRFDVWRPVMPEEASKPVKREPPENPK
ncbi:hypothetical protein AAVH_03338 [Aphelenchoides avenae]|nr:hypothetical protein AAVH_03338 [Aphelenchus avenae]